MENDGEFIKFRHKNSKSHIFILKSAIVSSEPYSDDITMISFTANDRIMYSFVMEPWEEVEKFIR